MSGLTVSKEISATDISAMNQMWGTYTPTAGGNRYCPPIGTYPIEILGAELRPKYNKPDVKEIRFTFREYLVALDDATTFGASIAIAQNVLWRFDQLFTALQVAGKGRKLIEVIDEDAIGRVVMVEMEHWEGTPQVDEETGEVRASLFPSIKRFKQDAKCLELRARGFADGGDSNMPF